MTKRGSKSAPTVKTEQHHPPKIEQDHLGLERIVFFSDAVFAIAITLLALEIRLPAVEGELTNAELAQALLDIWPKYLGYIISFLVLGTFWANHHRKFRLIQRYDRNLMLLNLLLLMVIAFVPFPTAIISEYGNRTATIFYACIIALASILSATIWWYALHRNRLVDLQMKQQQRRQEIWRPLIVFGIFIASIGLSFINDDLAKLSWILVGFVQVR